MATALTHIVVAQQIFAPIGAKWHYSSAPASLGFAPYAAFWLYESEKDTMVEGIMSQKIAIKYINHLGDTLTNFDPFITYTSGDTVMYFNNFINKFTPLYIFNVSIGDTLTYYKPMVINTNNDSTFRVVVDSIDFIPVNGINLKRVFSRPLDHIEFKQYYVERLGGSVLMLPENSTALLERDLGPLRCYADSDVAINLNIDAKPCDFRIIVSVDDIKLNEKMDVFPNPVSSQVSIRWPHDDVQEIFIYNLHGQPQKIDVIFKQEKEIHIDLSSFSSGIYFLQLRFSNGENYVQKILKE